MKKLADKVNPFAKKKAKPPVGRTPPPAGAATPKDKKAEQQAAEDAKAEQLDNLLPWQVENKIAFLFSGIKVPFILFVGFFGTLTEWQVRGMTLHQWERDHFHSVAGPSCYVHKLDKHKFPKHAQFSLVQWLNETVMFGTLGKPKTVKVADVNWEMAHKDLCGFQTNNCQPDKTMVEAHGGGAMHMLPLAILWSVYKLLFIGVHPFDRAMKKLLNKPPYFKLFTEPHFQNHCGGLISKPMSILVKALGFMRYKLMPNIMMAALGTMQMHPHCKDLLRYRYDWFWSSCVYWMIFLEFITHTACYYLAFKSGSKLIGDKKYRCYKVYWFVSSFLPATICFWTITTTIQWNIFRLIRLSFTLSFTFDVSFAFYVDFLQAFLFFIVVLEFLELYFFILQIICPKTAGLLPLEMLDNIPFIAETGGQEDDKDQEVDPLLVATSGDESGTAGGVGMASEKPPAQPSQHPARP